MIKNKRIAEGISTLMIDIVGRLNDSIFAVQDACPDAEFKTYRLAVAKVMAEVLLEVQNPLYAEHPDLKPKGLE